MRRNKWLILALAAILFLASGPITPSAADPGLPTCVELKQKVTVCYPSWVSKPNFQRVQEIIDEILVPGGDGIRQYPPMTIYLVHEDVMGENFGGYYLSRNVILLAANKQTSRSFTHELWHHRLTTWGMLVADQHCAMGKSEEYMWSTHLNEEDSMNHKMKLLLQCPGMYADYPPED